MTGRVILTLLAIIAAGAWVWVRAPARSPASASTADAASPGRAAAGHQALGPRAPEATRASAPIDSSPASIPTGSSRAATPGEAEARRIRHIEAFVRNLQRDYVDLGEVAGLTDAERDTVLLLIAAYRVDDMEVELAHPADGLAAMRESELREKQRRADLVRLLGAERTARVLNFETTVPIRMETRLAADVLADSAWPMTAEQSRRLTAAAIEAFERQSAPGVARSGAENPDALQQEDLARLDQDRATLLRVARGVLNAEQFAYYEDFMQQREIFRGDVIDAPVAR